jgi:5'-3' exonuclease
MVKVIVDFSQLLYKIYFVKIQNEIVEGNANWNFWKYLILNSLKNYISTFMPDELILACDSAYCWRKNFYKGYKGARIHSKNQCDELFPRIDDFIEELKRIFPFKVVKVEESEADDIIGVLSFNKNKDDIFYIISTDKDFIPLIKYNNVKIYNPILESFVATEFPFEIKKVTFESIDEFKNYLIFVGDSGDSVPNIFNSGEEERAKPFGPVKFKKLYKEGLDKWVELQSEVIKNNIERNKKLVLLDKEQIPEYIQEKIMKEYNNINVSFKKEEIEEYFRLTEMESFYGKSNEFNPKSYKIFF